MNEYDTIPVKIIMIGSLNVGKTTLITQYSIGETSIKTQNRENASYVSKIKKINGFKFEIRLWDTAGQEKYKSLPKLFLKDANIAILVYSIDNEESFKDLDTWFELIKSNNDETIIYGVCANKSDLVSEENISDERGKEYAKKIGAEWTSTSAIINGKGIDKFVETLFIKYYNNNFTMTNAPSLSITLSSEKTKVEKKSCCGGGGDEKIDKNQNNTKSTQNN